ncbi:MAG TPA: delta-60 repeat domain-containing protein, partial [Pyrinomonadaceae bacterium]|nr:delta-60 repeat domain-containing protein [Pyrinomonadaceae bacterium]
MSKNLLFPLLSGRHFKNLFIFAFFSIFAFSLPIKAQPGFSKEQLQLLKAHRIHPDLLKDQMPSESFPAAINLTNKTSLADGDLDPTFNASVTESSGYVDDSIVQPDGKIVIAGSFQRVNGTRVGNIARLNADGTLDTSFNAGTGTTGAIRTIALQPDG